MALSDFPRFDVSVTDGRYELNRNSERFVFYSARSGSRDQEYLRGILTSAEKDGTSLVIAPYRREFGDIFTETSGGMLLTPCEFEPVKQHPRIIADDSALEHFINSINPLDKFKIIVVPQWGSATAEIYAIVQRILQRAAIRLKTIGHFEKLWPINFRLNAAHFTRYENIAELAALGPPDILVMAGPSLDAHVANFPANLKIWCADTALPALAKRKLSAEVVFSIDAGFASSEHFIGRSVERMVLVTDLLAAPAVHRKPFFKEIIYHSSHPLVDSLISRQEKSFTYLNNPQGDVGSLMLAVYASLYGDKKMEIFGHDRGQRRYVTHARGTAYFSRRYQRQTRVDTVETYMLRLSRRY